MYEDKLDGVIDEAQFKRKADENRAQQATLADQIERHQQAIRITSRTEQGCSILRIGPRKSLRASRRQSSESCCGSWWTNGYGRTASWNSNTANRLI